MARLRYNNESGTIGSLSSSGTTITFEGTAPTFPTIPGGSYIPLSLDPDTTSFEVVWLVAYTSGADTGTIERGQEGTTGVTHAVNAVWDHAPLAMDFPAALTGDVLVTDGSSAASVQGTTNVESIIRANTLDELGPPQGAMNWNGQSLFNIANPASQTGAVPLQLLSGVSTKSNLPVTVTSASVGNNQLQLILSPSETFGVGHYLCVYSASPSTWNAIDGNWSVVSSNGASVIVTWSGSVGGTYTADSASVVPSFVPNITGTYLVSCVGGGGGGGGGGTTSTASVNQMGGGGGGQGESVSFLQLMTASVGYPIINGAAGIGGGGANNGGFAGSVGSSGGNTTVASVSPSNILVTATGGSGGTGAAATTATTPTAGGAYGGGTGTNGVTGLLAQGYSASVGGFFQCVIIGAAGTGGPCFDGFGLNAGGNGGAAVGFGCGGGGGGVGALYTAVLGGGAGAPASFITTTAAGGTAGGSGNQGGVNATNAGTTAYGAGGGGGGGANHSSANAGNGGNGGPGVTYIVGPLDQNTFQQL